MRRRVATACIVLVGIAGCERCGAPRPAPDGGAAPFAITTLPPPAAWIFSPVRMDFDVAAPERCATRAPLVRAPVARTTRFVAEPRTLGFLAIADGAEDPPRLVSAAALALDPAGPTHDPKPIPWLVPSSAPRLGHTPAGRWIAAFERPGDGGASRVGLFRDGVIALVGEGDAFEATDLACAGERCALLTSRVGRVAIPGALIWSGNAADPASLWHPTELAPAEPESEARPFGLASVEAAPDGGLVITATLIDRGEIVIDRIEGGKAQEKGRIPAHHGLIDVLDLPARTVAMTYGTPLDDDGCVKPGSIGGASIRFERTGLPSVEMKTPAPPLGGSLRRLDRGALATWIAPLGCGRARRVVYAVVLDGDGAPVSAPMAVADASSFAVAASGADVDLWIQNEARVTWMRLRCAAP
ncbi:MAG: hypothetical protein ABJE95_24635 [Byssovorax sp.]